MGCHTIYDLDLDKLFPTDDPVVVDVVEGESPLQLVLRRPLRDDGEELHEVPERYAASTIPGMDWTKVEGYVFSRQRSHRNEEWSGGPKKGGWGVNLNHSKSGIPSYFLKESHDRRSID